MNSWKKLPILLYTLVFVLLIMGLAGCSSPTSLVKTTSPAATTKTTSQTTAAMPASPAEDAYNRGMALFKEGNFEKAIAELTKAIELDPGYVPAYLQRGVIYYKNGQYDLAIADSSKAIELDPEYIDAYDTRGNAYKDSGQTDKAIADYQKIVELSKNPDQVKYYNDRLASLGQPPSGFTGFSGDSVYDGEFIGEFTYWYKEWHTDAEGHTVESDWKPETLRVSLTLKALVSDELVRQSGVTSTVVNVTHVWVSDLAFGTGLAGITPVGIPMNTLPLDATTPTNPSLLGMGIFIDFPNGASLFTNNNAGALSVSFPVVPTLSSSLDPTWEDSTWSAVLPAGSGSILGYDDPSNHSGYAIKYKKWTLTKSNR